MKLLYTLLLTIVSLPGLAQSSPVEPAYKRMPFIPAIDILLGDSATRYTKASLPKKTPVFIMLFSPDCSHCQQTAEEMIAHKEALRDIHIIMATMHSLAEMNDFVRKYELAQLPNLTVGKDINYIFLGFYNVKHLPFMAFYNKKGALITASEGALPIPKVLEIFRENK